MIRTFYGLGDLSTPGAFLAALFLGAAFGFALERAGFGSSRRLAALFYLRDMTVLKVMFTAVITAVLGLSYALGLGLIGIDQVYLLPSVYGAQVIGGLIFGVGFVMGGWCPGTAAVGAASGKSDALVFLGGAVAGSILYNEVYPLVEPLASWGDHGASMAYAALGMSRAAFAFMFTLAALGCFWAAEYVEKRVSGTGRYFRSRFLSSFSIVLVFLAVGLFAFPAEETRPDASGAGPDEAALLGSVAQAGDHIEPEELADRMVAGEPALLVIDVRPEPEYRTFHLRGAVNVGIADLHAYLGGRRNRGIVVLYSNGMVHPAQARDSLARAGHDNVYILTDGLDGFLERCLKPVSLRPEPVGESQARRISGWRGYFADPDAPPTAQAAGAGAAVRPPAKLPGLVTPRWLAENLGRSGLVVLDVRDQKEYNGGHVPGALALNVESLRGNVAGLPSMLLPAGMIAAHLSLLGIEPSDLVAVVYGGDKFRDATLAGMALERVGHREWAIVDGGWDAWIAGKHPASTAIPARRPTRYRAGLSADDFTVDHRRVLEEMRRGSTILDVRPADAFSGRKRDEARGGHIPGALNRPFTEDISGKSLKPEAELAQAYGALLPSRAGRVVVHCRTGHQASQTYFVLHHVLGYRDVLWYDAGWTEWASRPELPAESGGP